MNQLVDMFNQTVTSFNRLDTIDKFLLIQVILLTLSLLATQSDVKALKRDRL